MQNLLENKFLNNIILETLRLYSPAGFLFDRVALEDHYIEDIKIKKGDLVNVNIYAMNIDSKVFENPLQFIPDRWND